MHCRTINDVLGRCIAEGEGGDGGGRVWRVRRAVYSVQSPAARGVAWSWAGGAGGAGGAGEPLPMELQCRLEQAWRSGGQVLLLLEDIGVLIEEKCTYMCQEEY